VVVPEVQADVLRGAVVQASAQGCQHFSPSSRSSLVLHPRATAVAPDLPTRCRSAAVCTDCMSTQPMAPCAARGDRSLGPGRCTVCFAAKDALTCGFVGSSWAAAYMASQRVAPLRSL
jgi:hypothetical protein